MRQHRRRVACDRQKGEEQRDQRKAATGDAAHKPDQCLPQPDGTGHGEHEDAEDAGHQPRA